MSDQPAATASLRCAIYTRKSTEEGLNQEFNSLDAQREACEAYIKSQKNLGWSCSQKRYDDGGFTGANMERPAMKRLMADIEAGQIDVVVVYKVDRLSRSLLDFARIIELFEKRKISFVSVTQQFPKAAAPCSAVSSRSSSSSGSVPRSRRSRTVPRFPRSAASCKAGTCSFRRSLPIRCPSNGPPHEPNATFFLTVVRDEFGSR